LLTAANNCKIAEADKFRQDQNRSLFWGYRPVTCSVWKLIPYLEWLLIVGVDCKAADHMLIRYYPLVRYLREKSGNI